MIRPDFGQDAEFRRRFAQEVQAAQRVHVGLLTYQGKSPENDPSRFISVDVTVWRNAMDVVPTS